MNNSIESTLVEDRIFNPSKEVVAQARISGMPAYQELCKQANENPDEFWAKLAKEHLNWDKPFTRVLDESQAPFYKWFDDGMLNASANCLDRHLGTPTEKKVAIIFKWCTINMEF